MSVSGPPRANAWQARPAIELWTATATDIRVTGEMGNLSTDLTVSDTTGHRRQRHLVICDPVGTIFQATAGTGSTTIRHKASGAGQPAPGPDAIYDADSRSFSKLRPVRWYIGYNGRTDNDGNKLTSLYRTVLTSGADDKPPDGSSRGRDRHGPEVPQAGGSTYDAAPRTGPTSMRC